MGVTTEQRRLTIPGMAKKKPSGGKHKTARVNVGVPEPWHALARRLAAKRQQPVIYLLISLLKSEAEEEGMSEIPVPPWEEGATAPEDES